MKLTVRKISSLEKELNSEIGNSIFSFNNFMLSEKVLSIFSNTGEELDKYRKDFFNSKNELFKKVYVRFALRKLISEFNSKNGINEMLTEIEEFKTYVRLLQNAKGLNTINEGKLLSLEMQMKSMMNNLSNHVGTIQSSFLKEEDKKKLSKELSDANVKIREIQDKIAYLNSTKEILIEQNLVNNLKELNLI